MLINTLIQFSRSSPLGAPSEVGGGERGISPKTFFPRATGVRVGRPQDAIITPPTSVAGLLWRIRYPPLVKGCREVIFSMPRMRG